MVTTNQLISLDTVRPNGTDLVHLTGPLQVVARTTTDRTDGIALQVELRCDAARVRGVGLKTGARYWAQGVHRFRCRPGEFPTSFDLVSRFELLGTAPDGHPRSGSPLPRRLVLTVGLRVTVPADGRVTVAAEEVELLPESSS